jgi:hypothetical protein
MKNWTIVKKDNMATVAGHILKVLTKAEKISVICPEARGRKKKILEKISHLQENSSKKSIRPHNATVRVLGHRNGIPHIDFSYSFGVGIDGAFGDQIREESRVFITPKKIIVAKPAKKGKRQILTIFLFQ